MQTTKKQISLHIEVLWSASLLFSYVIDQLKRCIINATVIISIVA